MSTVIQTNKSLNETFNSVGIDRIDQIEVSKQIPATTFNVLREFNEQLDSYLNSYHHIRSPSISYKTEIETWTDFLLSIYPIQNRSSKKNETNMNDLVFFTICKAFLITNLKQYPPHIKSLNEVELKIQVLIDVMSEIAIIACESMQTGLYQTTSLWPTKANMDYLLYKYSFLLTVYYQSGKDLILKQYIQEESKRFNDYKENIKKQTAIREELERQASIRSTNNNHHQQQQTALIDTNQVDLALENALERLNANWVSLMSPSSGGLLERKDKITCRLNRYVDKRKTKDDHYEKTKDEIAAETLLSPYALKQWYTPIESGILFKEHGNTILERFLYIPCAIFVDYWIHERMYDQFPVYPFTSELRTTLKFDELEKRFQSWMINDFFGIDQPENVNNTMVETVCETRIPLGTRLWIARDLSQEYTKWDVQLDVLFQKTVGAPLGNHYKLPFAYHNGTELKKIATEGITNRHYYDLCLTLFAFEIFQDTKGFIQFKRDYLITGSKLCLKANEPDDQINLFKITRTIQGIELRPFLVQLKGSIYMFFRKSWEGPYKNWLEAILRWLSLIQTKDGFQWHLTNDYKIDRWRKLLRYDTL